MASSRFQPGRLGLLYRHVPSHHKLDCGIAGLPTEMLVAGVAHELHCALQQTSEHADRVAQWYSQYVSHAVFVPDSARLPGVPRLRTDFIIVNGGVNHGKVECRVRNNDSSCGCGTQHWLTDKPVGLREDAVHISPAKAAEELVAHWQSTEHDKHFHPSEAPVMAAASAAANVNILRHNIHNRVW